MDEESVEQYNLRKCDCGSEDRPVIYCEGLAVQYVDGKGKLSPLYWTSKDGYVVECSDCGAITRHFIDPLLQYVPWDGVKFLFQEHMSAASVVVLKGFREVFYEKSYL